jgi:hypothetical protein
MARYNTARVTVDLSPAQRAALDEMIARYNAEVGKVLGLDIRIGMGDFLRALLKQHAVATGQEWPNDYPGPGGKRPPSSRGIEVHTAKSDGR